ncbi:MAG: beta-galactosidase [Halobacteriovoraceae bacterium]|nr:beta-galactosidase [Halobacteriovoraceae bacterium]
MLKADDTIFPGENWFFYWKTSASLWPSKLEELKGLDYLIIPLNWAFHFEGPDSYDFGEKRGEADLKKLVDLAHNIRLNIIFYIPIGPAPWLPNGGLPSVLAQNCSLDKKGVACGVIDRDRFFNKLYSFFDPRVYQFFCGFMKKIGEYFSHQKISNGVFAIRCGHFKDNCFHAFFEDRSKMFSKSFARFLSVKKDEKTDVNITKDEFTEVIFDLYVEAIKKHLRDNWEGLLDIAFLEGSMDSFFSRLSGDRQKEYSNNIFSAVTHKKLISSILLPTGLRNPILLHQLSSVAMKYQEQTLDRPLDVSNGDFTPLYFFNFFHFHENNRFLWEEMGLNGFLNQNFKWTCQYSTSLDQDWVEEDENNYINFIAGKFLDEKSLGFVFKKFLNGGKIAIDNSDIPEKLQQKLSRFFLENFFSIEKVNFHIPIENITCGEGQILLFEGKQLQGMRMERKNWFWNSFMNTFEILHLNIKGDVTPFFWQSRNGSSQELDYKEVRRVHLYNPDDKRKKIIIPIKKNFVLLKVANQQDARLANTVEQANIELLSGGMMSLDFGVYN